MTGGVDGGCGGSGGGGGVGGGVRLWRSRARLCTLHLWCGRRARDRHQNQHQQQHQHRAAGSGRTQQSIQSDSQPPGTEPGDRVCVRARPVPLMYLNVKPDDHRYARHWQRLDLTRRPLWRPPRRPWRSAAAHQRPSPSPPLPAATAVSPSHRRRRRAYARTWIPSRPVSVQRAESRPTAPRLVFVPRTRARTAIKHRRLAAATSVHFYASHSRDVPLPTIRLARATDRPTPRLVSATVAFRGRCNVIRPSRSVHFHQVPSALPRQHRARTCWIDN